MLVEYKIGRLKVFCLRSGTQIVWTGSWVLGWGEGYIYLRTNKDIYNIWFNKLPFSVRNGYRKARKIINTKYLKIYTSF